MTTIRAHFDGKAFIPDERVEFPINQPLTLHVDESDSTAPSSITGKDFANSALFGIWKDRSDIGDSLEFARELRRRAQIRQHEIDNPQ